MNTNSTSPPPSPSPSPSSSEQCESGWTLYLEHSTQFHTAANYHNNGRREKIFCAEDHGEGFYDYDDDGDEEEDLSMVSDASSGPPHLDEEEAEELFCHGGSGGGGRKRGTASFQIGNVKSGRRRFDPQDFALDDTASSHPIMNVILSAASKKKGVHGVENQASSIKSLIDYSSQGFSDTHFQVVVESRKRREH